MKQRSMVAIPKSFLRPIITMYGFQGMNNMARAIEEEHRDIDEKFIVEWLGDKLQEFVEKYDKVNQDKGGVENFK